MMTGFYLSPGIAAGHKTTTVLHRYHILTEVDLRKALAQI
jgi:hypothetical protein